jgi:two-component system, NarL family, sensor histidine kinase DesK
LLTETEGAAALLRAANIDARVDLPLRDLPPAVDQVFAWTVREGITNVLRHTEARTCSIGAIRADGRARLEIVNDGAGPSSAMRSSVEGSGLAGLTARAEALGGFLKATRSVDGDFHLVVEVPVAAA